MKEVKQTNESRHYLLPLHKQVHDKRGIAESLHTTLIGLELFVCEVGGCISG